MEPASSRSFPHQFPVTKVNNGNAVQLGRLDGLFPCIAQRPENIGRAAIEFGPFGFLDGSFHGIKGTSVGVVPPTSYTREISASGRYFASKFGQLRINRRRTSATGTECPPARQIDDATQSAFKREISAGSGQPIELRQEDSSGSDLRTVRIKRRYAGGNQIGIHETHDAIARQERSRESGFPGSIRPSDNQATRHG